MQTKFVVKSITTFGDPPVNTSSRRYDDLALPRYTTTRSYMETTLASDFPCGKNKLTSTCYYFGEKIHVEDEDEDY